MLDITNETKPFPVSVWQVPVGNFCNKGGRFGPHQSAETVNGRINRFENKIAWLAYFNAGIRVLDLSNPYEMKELGYYIPKTNERSHPIAMGQPTAIQINDVDIDARGLAYASDRVGTPVRENSHRPDTFRLIPPDFENAPLVFKPRVSELLRQTPTRRLRPPVPAMVEPGPPTSSPLPAQRKGNTTRSTSSAVPSTRIVDLLGPLFRTSGPAPAGNVTGPAKASLENLAVGGEGENLRPTGTTSSVAEMPPAPLTLRCSVTHGAIAIASFLDCGLPSTVGAKNLSSVAKTIIARLNESSPDLIVIELGDGLLGGYSVESVFEAGALVLHAAKIARAAKSRAFFIMVNFN